MSLDWSKFQKVPLAEITEPKAGRICCGPSYWIMTEANEVLFYGKSHDSPQTNTNRAVVDHMLRNYPNCHVEFVPMAYLKHDCHDYR